MLVVLLVTILPGAMFANGSVDDAGSPPQSEISAAGLAEGERLMVVATTSILGNVVQTIGGDDIVLDLLIDAGKDPHAYQTTPQAMAKIERAHVVFVSGFGLEESLLEQVENTATGAVVSASTGIETDDSESKGGTDQDPDPHVWLDVRNVIRWAANISQTLSLSDPNNSERYNRRAELYVAELEELDSDIRSLFAEIPADKKKLVTDHDSLGRLASAYGFDVVATILPATTTAEMSSRQMVQIVELIKRERISTIFVGESVERDIERLVQTIASELESEADIRIVPLLIESLAPPGSEGDNYIDLMKYNARSIVGGLNR